MSLSNTPPTQSGISAEAALSSGPSALAGARAQAGEGLARRFSGGILMGIVVVIALLWLVPTFGLFVASFRPAALTNTTGWWEGVLPPWHFTIETISRCSAGKASDAPSSTA